MTDKKKLSLLSSPFVLRGHVLKNRVIFAPISTRMATTDGCVSEQMLRYYRDKAMGGSAMVVTETFHVDNLASRFTAIQPAIYHDRFMPGLSNLVDEIHKAGSIAIAQIGHAGRQTSFVPNGLQPVAPSRIPGGPTGNCHELTIGEIEKITKEFGSAAKRADTVGFDGVEIHAGNGYLLNEFLSPYTNRRTDDYGLVRNRFLLEVIEEVSNNIGSGSIVGVRLGCGDFVEGGLLPEEAIQISLSIPRDKVDYIHTSAGTSESNDYTIQPLYQERALLRHTSAEMKKRGNMTVILTGSVNNIYLAEEILEKQDADLVGMGRPLLADPYLPLKIQSHREAEVCPCIRCNQGCLGRVRLGKTIKCTVNPMAGYEESDGYWQIAMSSENTNHNKSEGERNQAKKRTKVLIAGAGPAGITAATRAKEMGCRVYLYEKEDIAGGLLNTARYEDFKQEVMEYLEYLINQLQVHKIEVVKSSHVDYSVIGHEKPDIFIDATGSEAIVPPVPNDVSYQIMSVRDVLLNLERHYNHRKVTIIGGGSSGCELGYSLAKRGVTVTVIEQDSEILSDLDPVSALGLRRLLKNTDIEILLDTRFLEFDKKGILTSRSGDPITTDLAVLSLGSRSRKELRQELSGTKWSEPFNYLRVGDAKKVGKLYDAIHSSYWDVTTLLYNRSKMYQQHDF